MLLSGAGNAQAAGAWTYTVSPADTPATIDAAATGAVVDTVQQEIRLPRRAGNAVAFWPDGGPDYVVMAPGRVIHFSWDGSKMTENTIASVSLEANPVGLAAPLPYPDVAVAMPDGIRRYSFGGSAMIENPALKVSGLAGVVALAVRDREDVAALVGAQVKYYQFDGSGMVENPWLEPTGLTNPIALALRPDTFDMAIADRDPVTGQERVRFFGFNGSAMEEIPALAITGLAGVKAVAYGDGGDVTVVAANQVRHYGFDGSTMTENTALTVTTGLTNPTAVAIRPGSPDRIIVDGDRVRYYAWDGSALVEDPSRSVTVAGLASLGAYALSAVAQSLGHDPGAPADRVRVRAEHVLEPNTQVTWYVTADGGSTWAPRWRVRADGAGMTACEVTTDAGTTWQRIGDAAACGLGADRPELWAAVPAGRDVRWRAELATTDAGTTPHIRSTPPGGITVRLEADARPLKPIPQPVTGCYTTTTPTLTWSFADPDPGDNQSAYQIEVRRQSDGAVVLDTGVIPGTSPSAQLPTSHDPAVPGPLWASGTYRFTWRVRVWDQMGQESDWSDPQPFCVTALERLRIAEIVAPPDGQVAPDPNDPRTHILIEPGMPVSDLPKVRAGARVRVIVDGIGPATEFMAQFPYTDGSGTTRYATLGDTSPIWDRPPGSETNRWTVDLWTEGRKDVVPDGTVVYADLEAVTADGSARLAPGNVGLFVLQGSVYDPFAVILWK